MFAAGKTSTSAAAQLYVDDVFSTYLYTGNGSTQTITNGIDLAGKGGLVWIKGRNITSSHFLNDTARGATYSLSTDAASAQVNQTTLGVTSFTNTGFILGNGSGYNGSSNIYASWTFRKAQKFFDVVTYTGTGANRTIAHSLGQVPGMISVKRTDTTGNWEVYHRSLANTEYTVLNSSAAKATDATMWNSTTATASVFSLGTNTNVNASGGTYVAYLFSHDTATDGIIQCGSFTTNASGNATVTLGWEPQWILVKRSSGVDDWRLFDNMVGIPIVSNTRVINPNTTSSEYSVGSSSTWPLATGFQITNGGLSASSTFIYVALRRSNKPPTDGTQVFVPTVYTGTNVNNRLVNTTISNDMVFVRQRDDTVLAGMVVGDRLRGQPYSLTGSSSLQTTSATALDQQIAGATEYGTAFSSMNGFWVGTDATAKLNVSIIANNQIAEAFKRATGFFDVVYYFGTGVQQSINHSLNSVPTLIITKDQGSGNWRVYNYIDGVNKYLTLNTTAATATLSGIWGTSPTTTQFSVGTGTDNNTNGSYFTAYLFANLSSISNVFSYTGNGTSQTINCGFTTGARFVLIKRTDSTGDWYVWDSARGIVAGNDPHLSLNTTAAEVTTDDSVDTDSTGFIVNQLAATNVNVTSATYIGLAIA